MSIFVRTVRVLISESMRAVASSTASALPDDASFLELEGISACPNGTRRFVESTGYEQALFQDLAEVHALWSCFKGAAVVND